ncbi:YebC/PmpR family DNA-binding transcriptional regulator, partial [Priestia megaterium]|uniref:YebC/PmpR family DNA-binding transcriptional regulator n=1 Tax=Priestia megaterium TaxID=1404 RepID=UPI0035B5E0B1
MLGGIAHTSHELETRREIAPTGLAQTLEAALGEPKSTAIAWRPKTLTPVEGEPVATLMKLIDALEDDDDVQNVYGNYDVSDADLETYAG